MNEREAAKLLGVSVSTVRRRAARGQIIRTRVKKGNRMVWDYKILAFTRRINTNTITCGVIGDAASEYKKKVVDKAEIKGGDKITFHDCPSSENGKVYTAKVSADSRKIKREYIGTFYAENDSVSNEMNIKRLTEGFIAYLSKPGKPIYVLPPETAPAFMILWGAASIIISAVLALV